MTQEHPITPPPELVLQWRKEWAAGNSDKDSYQNIATQAARWGADQELEACCEYLTRCAAWEPEDVQEMRDLRRPEPPSLKKQALEVLELNNDYDSQLSAVHYNIIRRALESLPS